MKYQKALVLLACTAGAAIFATSAISQNEMVEKDARTQASAPHVYHMKGESGPVDRAGMFDGEQIEVKLDAIDTEGRFSVMDFTFARGFSSAPGHFHAKHAETFILQEGRMEFMVEGEKRILGPGDLVYIPPNSYHSARTLDDKPARTIFIFDPAGFEEGIRARNALTEEQKNDPEFMKGFNRSIDYNFDPARGHDHGV